MRNPPRRRCGHCLHRQPSGWCLLEDSRPSLAPPCPAYRDRLLRRRWEAKIASSPQNPPITFSCPLVPFR